MSDDLEKAVGHDRRTFIKRLVVGTAFAAPVVSSFTMAGVQATFGSPRTGLVNPNTTTTTAPAVASTEAVVADPRLTG